MAGKPQRDRGRKATRPHPSTPRQVSVETVDAHTLIVRTPAQLDDEAVTFLADVLAAYTAGARVNVDTAGPVQAAGVWLTPDEAAAMEGRE